MDIKKVIFKEAKKDFKQTRRDIKKINRELAWYITDRIFNGSQAVRIQDT